MKLNMLRRCVFMLAASLLVLPWLTPCTLGVGTVGAALVSGVSRKVEGDDEVRHRLRDPQLKAWAAKPGPQIKILDQARITRGMIIQDSELATNGKILQVTSKDGVVQKGSTSAMNSLATLLALSDLTTQFMASSSNGTPLSPWPSKNKKRREIVLSRSPYVLLQASVIAYAGKESHQSQLMRATGGARLTVITPEGTFFALASRIHLRGEGTELLLEGNPTVQSGQQHIKAEKPEALMKLNFATRTVTIEGKARETRF
ncbi:hypothetical protein [Prosthecobacter sp.]|uniref:hypothetical protein n=1 Tax=Prosthecobacter sp. TaxID=1965333 RepID=UPI003783A5F3